MRVGRVYPAIARHVMPDAEARGREARAGTDDSFTCSMIRSIENTSCHIDRWWNLKSRREQATQMACDGRACLVCHGQK